MCTDEENDEKPELVVYIKRSNGHDNSPGKLLVPGALSFCSFMLVYPRCAKKGLAVIEAWVVKAFAFDAASNASQMTVAMSCC